MPQGQGQTVTADNLSTRCWRTLMQLRCRGKRKTVRKPKPNFCQTCPEAFSSRQIVLHITLGLGRPRTGVERSPQTFDRRGHGLATDRTCPRSKTSECWSHRSSASYRPPAIRRRCSKTKRVSGMAKCQRRNSRQPGM